MARNKTPFPHAAFSFGLDRPTTGRVFYVNSAAANASNGNLGDSPDRPLATIEGFYNHGDLTANNGDTCYVMPNHEETVTGAGGITADIAGTRLVGIGWGAQRPRVLMDGGTTVSFVVSAADTWVENIVFASGHADVVTCFDVDAAGFNAHGCEFVDNTTDENFLSCFTVGSTTDNTCDYLTISGNNFISPDAGPTTFINLTGDTDFATITDNFVVVDAATCQFLLHAAGDDLQMLRFERNHFVTGATSGDLMIDNNQTDNTGIAAYNLCGSHDAAAMVMIDADGIRQFENYHTDADTTSGALIPAASSIT